MIQYHKQLNESPQSHNDTIEEEKYNNGAIIRLLCSTK